MDHDFVPITISSLAVWGTTQLRLFMRGLRWRCQSQILATGILAFSCVGVQASVNIYFAASAPPSLQNNLIAGLTTQYNAQVTLSPYFANTYTVTISSANPAGTCGATTVITQPCELDQDISNMIAVSTYTGVYMFGSGMVYQQDQQEDFVGEMNNLCGSATSYTLIQSSTGTFSKATCQDVTGTIEDELFNEQLSTPTVIPPEDAL
jgi:hypothetical protein